MPLPPLVEPAAELSAREASRYARHLLVPGVGPLGQRRLKAARVLCVGAGGLGSAVLPYLAAAGVGTLGVVDDDAVEESNLQRQVLHDTDDVGRAKTDSAADRLRALNPYVEVVRHRQRLAADSALELLSAYDLVVDGSDNFATRYVVNDACVLLGKPDVWGSILRFDGQAGVFWAAPPADGPCYRCLYPHPPEPGSVPSCAEAGVLGVLCATIGAAQATEAIKLITGVGSPLVGRLLVHDALAPSYDVLPLRKDPDCPVCAGPARAPTATTLQELAAADSGAGGANQDAVCGVAGDAEISVHRLAERLARRDRGEEDFVLVDVREPHEHELARLPGSVLVPLDTLRGGALDALPRDRQVVLHCRSGGRSAQAVALLRRAGYADAVHVAGGLLAWAGEIDPSVPTY